MIEPIVELKGISKSFGKKIIFNNLDLKIYPGDALGVIGPSGTGKSTILRLIAGLMSPDAGEVYIQGQKRQWTVEEGGESMDVGMVFQQSALFDSLTVNENVGFALYRYSKLPPPQIREQVDLTLEIVGLPGIGDLYPAELSGGMRKRVSLARSIITDPQNTSEAPHIILYDEPTAGLDPVASTKIENLICDLLNQHNIYSTYTIVTHQDSTIRRTTKRIVFLYRGKIQWDGSTSEAYTSDHPLLKQFFSGSVEGSIQ
ncbi:similar to sulfate transport ATP-binding protein CysA [Stanieria sp. NIES-3757]|nr:similar to sulfate transport ATP-binding protein CysA [Stanieria sp. NIES-3757]